MRDPPSVTSDCLVDVLELWWQRARERYCQVRTLVINLDNGPENQSHRTQFLKRLVDFAQVSQLTIHLAYYPPYHSKYNPVERCWGILERHWNGDVLDTVETVVKFAQTMSLQRKHSGGSLAHDSLSHWGSLNEAGHD